MVIFVTFFFLERLDRKHKAQYPSKLSELAEVITFFFPFLKGIYNQDETCSSTLRL